MLTFETIFRDKNDEYFPTYSQWALEVIQINLKIVMICAITIHLCTVDQVLYYFITIFIIKCIIHNNGNVISIYDVFTEFC